MSVYEIVEPLGVRKDTVYTWVSSKRMPGRRVGRFWTFKKEDVEEWVRAGGEATEATADAGATAADGAVTRKKSTP